MGTLITDLSSYMEDKIKYIAVRDTRKRGSAIVGFTRKELKDFASLRDTCVGLARSPLQVISITGINTLIGYPEYAPYYEVSIEELLEICRTQNCPGKEV